MSGVEARSSITHNYESFFFFEQGERIGKERKRKLFTIIKAILKYLSARLVTCTVKRLCIYKAPSEVCLRER